MKDIIIVGAGLSGLSLAFRLQQEQPHLNIQVLEKNLSFASNKTWSFHGGDVENIKNWKEIISHHWKTYNVRFSYEREINQDYYSISSDSFFKIMKNKLVSSLSFGVDVIEINNQSVRTKENIILNAKVVIDARSNDQISFKDLKKNGCGFQKFVGLEFKTKFPHKISVPILMDATVEQKDGFRFMYVLPYNENTLLVEDTRYSNTEDINLKEIELEIFKYIQNKNLQIEAILRTEQGVLPIPISTPFLSQGEKIKIGADAGFFHPVTGYSFLWVARISDELAKIKNPNPENYLNIIRKLKKECKQNERFYLLLNKMMFHASDSTNRYKIFERFYKFSDHTIDRFYSSKINMFDYLKILIGRPPISVFAALKVLRKKDNNLLLKEVGEP